MGDTSSGDEPPLKKAAGWAAFDSSFLANPPAVFAGLVYTLFGLASLAILVTGGWILLQFVFQTLTTTPKDFEDTGRRLLAFGLVVAAPFAIWRIVVSHWQARAAQAQAIAAARQADVAREEHYTSLFTAAVQQLGALREIQEAGQSRTEPNTEARLGAIYALERIAQDSERDHWPIMETLCAYVRNNAGPPALIFEGAQAHLEGERRFGGAQAASVADARPPVDVQAAITVIGRRSKARCAYEVQLRNGANDPSSYSLDLTQTNLSRILLSGNFDSARFDDTSLAHCKMRGVSLISASFFGASAEGASVVRADLAGAILVNSDWRDARMHEVKADEVYAAFVNFSGAHIRSLSMTHSELLDAKFNGTVMIKTDLTGSELQSAELVGTELHSCTMQDIDLSDARVGPMRLKNCRCEGATGLRQEMIDASFGDEKTILPDDLVRPESWMGDNSQLKAWRAAASSALAELHRERKEKKRHPRL